MAAVGVALAAAACTVSTIDVEALEEDIRTGFQEQADEELPDVGCPEDVEPAQGDVFLCTATADDGTVYTIEVTQQDDEGNVVWEVTGSEAPAE